MVSAEGERRKKSADPGSVEVVVDVMLELGVSIDAVRRRLVKLGERYDFPFQVDLRRGFENGGWRYTIKLDGQELKRCVAADADLGIALIYTNDAPSKRTKPCDCEPGLHLDHGDTCSPLSVVRGKIEVEAMHYAGWVPSREIGSPSLVNGEVSINFTALPPNNDAAYRQTIRDAAIPELSRLSVRAPRAELQIHHLDGDPRNHMIDNLEMVDPAENSRAVVYGAPEPQLVEFAAPGQR